MIPLALTRLDALRALPKLGLVLGGYVAALMGALGIVWCYVVLTDSPEREASAGMSGFGDMLFFLAAFGAFSIVPTALALFLARRSLAFWTGVSATSLAIAATGLASVGLDAGFAREAQLSGWLVLAVALAMIRIFVSPFCAASFGLAALVAPAAHFRWMLAGAAAMECATSAYGLVRWFALMFFR